MLTQLAVHSDEVDDAALIEQSVVEPEMFRLLYERYAGAIHRYVARRVGVDTADDVVAETFLLAFRQRARYDVSRRAAGPWLYGIASNTIAKHHRAEVRLYRAYSRTGVDPVIEPYVDVDGRLVAAACRRQLAGALARLPAKDRDVLLLVAWAELSYEQVSQALGIPVGTVRSRLNRARRKVRSALDGINPMVLGGEYESG